VHGKPNEILDGICKAVVLADGTKNPTSSNNLKMRVSKYQPGKRVVVQVLTPLWLDLVTFELKSPGGEKDEAQCTLRAFARSTGIFPITWPLSPLLNLAFFPVPFTDGGRKNCRQYIDTIMSKTNFLG